MDVIWFFFRICADRKDNCLLVNTFVLVPMCEALLHNERDGLSDHRYLGCLINRLFRRRSKKTSKLRVIGLCEGNSPVIGEFPTQRYSNAENISIWWRHHGHHGENCNIEITKGCPGQYVTVSLSECLSFICNLWSNKLVLNWILIWVHIMEVFSQRTWCIVSRYTGWHRSLY